MNDIEWANLRETVEKNASAETKEFTVIGFQTGIAPSYRVELVTKEGRKQAFDISDYSCW